MEEGILVGICSIKHVYEIKASFRLVIGLASENVMFRS